LEQLKTALSRPDLSTVHDAYSQFVVHIDDGVSETLNFEIGGQPRSVALVNPWPTDSGNIENYPPALVNLLLEIAEARRLFDASVR
jgi:hypothetical protein